MLNRRSILDLLLVLGVSAFIFLFSIAQNGMGFWEPWETSTLLAAQRMAQSSILESTFWIPQVGNTFVAQPLLQLWLLSFILHVFPEPDPFWIRLPGALAGMFVVLLTFLAVKQIATRRAAWFTVAILLTLPMFVLGGKMIHGDIWLIVAVSVPQLFYLLATHATTRRMHRTMLVFSGLSCILSFIAGGLFAIAILALCGALFLLFMRNHPQKAAYIHPLCTKFFLVSLFIAFVICGGIFGVYVTQSRFALEQRIPMTLAEINDALDADRVIAIERRDSQIIGTVKTPDDISDAPEQNPFILVESHSNLNTNATKIFEQNEAERKTFVNDLMWRFQKQTPPRAEKRIPDIQGAFENALRFFWLHTNSAYRNNAFPLVRTTQHVNAYEETTPILNAHRNDTPQSDPNSPIIATQAFAAENGTLLRVLNDDHVSPWIEVQNGAYKRGYIDRDDVESTEIPQNIRWFAWIDILLYGLFPWACFCPIAFACLFTSYKKLAISNEPFIGEFNPPLPQSDKNRAALQILFIAWLIADFVALFVGINQSNRVFFAGLVPTAILFGTAISSQTFWHSIRNSLESRLGLILFSWIALFVALNSLSIEPYRLVRYLLTDPLMHWGNFDNIPTEHILFAVIFVLLSLLAFTGMAENLQTQILALKERFKRPKRELRTSSSATFMRVSREDTTPMPYAAAMALVTLALLSSAYIYHAYIPSITDNLTEESLIQRYFQLADQSEPIYLLSGDSAQLCLTYRDCDAGYVCQNSRCKISTFSSYSLDVAKPISRTEMLRAIDPNNAHDPAFFIIPKDTLFDINNAYRLMQAEGNRQNLRLVDAPSSRLYLIANHESTPSINPLDRIFIDALPKDATKIQIPLDDEIEIQGFKIEKLDFSNDKSLTMTIFYKVRRKLQDPNAFLFEFEISARKLNSENPLLPNGYDETELAKGDLVADTISFNFPMMPSHDILAIKVASAKSNEFSPLTSIDF